MTFKVRKTLKDGTEICWGFDINNAQTVLLIMQILNVIEKWQ
jgi:hypothetical protein